MGLCTSCDASAVRQSSTAKLILADGSLKEFDRPVRAWSALAEEKSDRWFVCDADEMDFDRCVSAVGSDEWLRPGQIYFVLPRSKLRSPLQADELARLAVKASAALVRSSEHCGKSSLAPLVFESKEEVAAAANMVVPTVSERRRRRSRSGIGSGCKFASDLSAIEE